MKHIGWRLSCSALCLLLGGCGAVGPAQAETTSSEAAVAYNPVVWFEIPVRDMDRAVRFYEALFGLKLQRRQIDGHDMALFPRTDGAPGSSGALAHGEVYVPSKSGAILYFDVADIEATLARATAIGAATLYPVTDVGEAGLVAEIEDSEGNRIALSQSRA